MMKLRPSMPSCSSGCFRWSVADDWWGANEALGFAVESGQPRSGDGLGNWWEGEDELTPRRDCRIGVLIKRQGAHGWLIGSRSDESRRRVTEWGPVGGGIWRCAGLF